MVGGPCASATVGIGSFLGSFLSYGIVDYSTLHIRWVPGCLEAVCYGVHVETDGVEDAGEGGE
jgi:hypothetical protein